MNSLADHLLVDLSDLNTAMDALIENAGVFRTILDNAPVGVIAFDQNHFVKWFNPAVLLITGHQEASFSGLDESRFLELLSSLSNQNDLSFSARPAKLDLNSFLRDGNTLDYFPTNVTIALAGRTSRSINLSRRETNASKLPVIYFIRDVTEEIASERLKSEFLAIAAHELRGPMSSILGFSEILLNLSPSKEEETEYLGFIHEQTLLLTQIINELLDLARIEAKQGMDFVMTDVFLFDLISETAKAFQPPKGREPVRIKGDNRDLVILGDYAKLTQVLNNIISNAYKYSPDNSSVDIEILSGSKTNNTHKVGFCVTDQGIGLNAEQTRRIFEKFYRANPASETPGTGLGMSIVKEIIDLHKGEIEIVSNVGSGTSITVLFPQLISRPPSNIS
jgi:signal transduction histidine kinase